MLLDFSFPDIIKHCNTMAYLNIMSFCVLSGCGHTEPPNELEKKEIKELTAHLESDVKPRNIFFTQSLYKKALPKYLTGSNHEHKNPNSVPYDFRNFLWTDKKPNRKIEARTMALSIACMVEAAEKIMKDEILTENKDFIIYCLLRNASKQAGFMIKHMKVGDLYYDGEDILSQKEIEIPEENKPYAKKEIHVELNIIPPDLLTQFWVMESFFILKHELEGTHLEHLNQVLPDREFNLLTLICENVLAYLNSIPSRELSLICLSLLSMGRFDSPFRGMIHNTLTVLGCELLERLGSDGNMARSMLDPEFSSVYTLFNSLHCFSELFSNSGIDRFYEAALLIYETINRTWDESLGLFILWEGSKLRYTIRDIGYIFSALRAFRRILIHPDQFMQVEKQLSAFYRTALLNSRIFNCQTRPILQADMMELNKTGTCAKDMAPTFRKNFEIKRGKGKYYCEADIFQTDYVLCACKQLLI